MPVTSVAGVLPDSGGGLVLSAKNKGLSAISQKRGVVLQIHHLEGFFDNCH